MQDLIARLEAATEGSRELDAEIALANGWEYVDPLTATDPLGPPWKHAALGYRLLEPPQFSTSLDAALTLVPEGWTWNVSDRAPKPHAGRAYINNRELQIAGIGGLARNPKYRGEEATAFSPALALCIACLHARSVT